MIRLKLVLVMLGGMLAFSGCQEFRVSKGATAEPLPVELNALEQNPIFEDPYLEIGDHWALYPYAVYEYKSDNSQFEPTENSEVNYTYYPIISYEHPYFLEFEEFIEKNIDRNLDNIPDEEFPSIEEFAVLVKTFSFKTYGQIPDDPVEEASIQGLIINRVEGLDAEEKALIQEAFPTIDPENLLILQAGRRPSSGIKSLGMIAGGGGVSLLGLGWLFLPRLKGA